MPTNQTPRAGLDLKRWWRHGDTAWQGIVIAMAFFVLVIMVAIGWSVWSASADSRAAFGFNFVAPTSDSNWDPVNNLFHAWPIITGTLITAVIAIIMATPVSLGIASFISELGRALGETMAVTMVIGNNTVESTGSLLVPGATLASTIANEFAEAVTKLHTSALIELGLILFVITLILNMIARLLVWRVASLVPTDSRA